MKRFFSILLAGSFLLLTMPAFSAFEDTAVLTMQSEPMEGEHSWAEQQTYIAFEKETGEKIPLSECESGYFYALVPEGTQVEFRSVPDVAFTDLDESSQPIGLDALARRGIFVGDETGAFRAMDQLTRAQMVALMARLIRENGDGSTPFADVPADSWFAGPVSALLARGVLANDTMFYPERLVTRQEFSAMTARLLRSIGLLRDAEQTDATQARTTYLDFADAESYAQEAYAALYAAGYPVPCDTVYDAERDPLDLSPEDLMLNPRSEVTRGDASQYLYELFRCLMLECMPAIPRPVAMEFGFDAEMPRIDGSTSAYPLTESLYWNFFINSANHPRYPKKHTKTITAYERLIAGEADIIFVPDPNEEVKQLAEKEHVELEYIPIANEALVFFTGMENPAENLTSEQIKDIYLNNAVTDWEQLGAPSAPFAAFCRNNDSGSHAQMERFFLEGQEINGDIRQERTSIAMSNIITDLLQYEQENPGNYALGYSMYYYIQNSRAVMGDYAIKLLGVDGVVPTAENIADGSYPLATNYFAVIRSDAPADSPARKLATFLTGEAGQELVQGAGFGAIH